MRKDFALSTLWIVSEVYYPEETSTGHYLTAIAEALAKDRTVSVICAKPNYSKRGKVVPWREMHENVTIFRGWSTALDKNNFIFRIINALTVSLGLTIIMMRRVNSGELVLVGTNPPTLPFLASFVCMLKRADCVLKAEDIYPDSLIAAGVVSRHGFLARLMNFAQGRLLKRMKAVYVIGRDMAILLKRKAAPAIVDIKWIPNWADSNVIFPETRDDNGLIQELGLRDKFIVGYAGNMGPLQGLDYLFDCALHMRKHSDVHFVFVGGGKRYDWFKNAVNTSGIDNVTLVGHRPRSDQQNFLNACDLAVVSLISGMSGVGVPSRTYNFLAAGKPLLAAVDADSEIASLVGEEKVGWVVEPGRTDSFIAAVLDAKSDLTRLGNMGRKARLLAETKYSQKNILAQYRAMLNA